VFIDLIHGQAPVIVGSFKALWIAVKNDKPVKRNSLVKEKLMRLAGGKRPA
jgi:hypothetical protein